MSLVTDISSDSCSMEVSTEAAVTVTRKYEKLEIRSGINLCFNEKRGVEADEGFVSDTLSSSGGMHIFGKRSFFEHQSYEPMIQEIDLQDVADCKDLLVHDNDQSSIENGLSYSVNADSCGNFMKEETYDSSFLCKFKKSFSMFCCMVFNSVSLLIDLCVKLLLCVKTSFDNF